jgi:lipopolysaccharide export system protein LptA
MLIPGFAVARLPAQNLTTGKLASPAKAQAKVAEKDPLKAALTGNKSAPASTEPITTEIYADEVFFDSAKSIGIFTGRVIVKDPRFNVQSDKMTIYMTKGQTPAPTPKPETDQPPSALPMQGLEKAVAEGNVGVVREQPGENGGPPTRSVGRSDIAIYTTSDGNVELRGSPRVQSGMNTHVATSPDTVMIISQDSKLVTHGPSRTEIRQEAKAAESPKPAATPKP